MKKINEHGTNKLHKLPISGERLVRSIRMRVKQQEIRGDAVSSEYDDKATWDNYRDWYNKGEDVQGEYDEIETK